MKRDSLRGESALEKIGQFQVETKGNTGKKLKHCYLRA